MSFDISLTSGMRNNLVALQGTARLLNRTQDRLSSGKSVNTAIDDPSKFFASQGHNNRASDLSARKADMGEAVQTVRAANQGITSITALINQAKALVQSARSASTADRATLGAQFNTIRNQIDQIASDSGYNGKNFLESDSLKVMFNENGSSYMTVVGFAANASGMSIVSATLGGVTATHTAESVNSVADAYSGASFTLANFGSIDDLTLSRTSSFTGQTLDNSSGATTATAVTSVGGTLALGHVGVAASVTLTQTFNVTAATVTTATAGVVSLTAGSDAYIVGTTGTNTSPTTITVAASGGTIAKSAGDYTVNYSAVDDAYYLHAVTDLTGDVKITYTASKDLTAGTDYNITTGSGISAAVVTATRSLTGIVAASYSFTDTLTAGAGASYVNSTVGISTASTITFSGGITGLVTATYTLAAASEWGTDAALDTDNDNLNTAIQNLRTQASTMAANLGIITIRQDWSQGMVNTLTAGSDGLTLADMNEEGANLLALQTRQQLGIQALSLASQANQSIMRLF